MRKWIWTGLVALLLVTAGGLVYAHSGKDAISSPITEEEPPCFCPLRWLIDLVHGH